MSGVTRARWLTPRQRGASPRSVMAPGYAARPRYPRRVQEQAVAGGERSIGALGEALTGAPVGLGLVDANLRYVWVNDALAALVANGVGEPAGLAAELEPLCARVIETGDAVLGQPITGSGHQPHLV